jgi:hypothetical protein
MFLIGKKPHASCISERDKVSLYQRFPHARYILSDCCCQIAYYRHDCSHEQPDSESSGHCNEPLPRSLTYSVLGTAGD